MSVNYAPPPYGVRSSANHPHNCSLNTFMRESITSLGWETGHFANLAKLHHNPNGMFDAISYSHQISPLQDLMRARHCTKPTFDDLMQHHFASNEPNFLDNCSLQYPCLKAPETLRSNKAPTLRSNKAHTLRSNKAHTLRSNKKT